MAPALELIIAWPNSGPWTGLAFVSWPTSALVPFSPITVTSVYWAPKDTA